MTGNDERLDEIAARADAASPGPWPHAETLWAGRARDAEFIAHAREDIPWLLSRLRDARAEIERLNLVVAAMDSQADEIITEVLALTADRDHWRTEWEDADVKRITAEAELAAERAKLEEANRLLLTKFYGYDTRDLGRAYDADSVDELLADLRAALAGGE